MEILFLLIPIILSSSLILTISYMKNKKKNEIIKKMSKLSLDKIIEHDNKNKLKLKLAKAGITMKECNEVKYLFAFLSLIVVSAVVFYTKQYLYIIPGLILIGLSFYYGCDIHCKMEISKRDKKLEEDLGVFLDLVNVILEAGNSLKNSFLIVSTRADNIIKKELLKEISILEKEMNNFSTIQAYKNFKMRTDSEQLHKVIDFLILSEETGIGVRQSFKSQSEDMINIKKYKVKGKISMLKVYLILVIFFFVLPAAAAFVVIPIKAGFISLGTSF